MKNKNMTGACRFCGQQQIIDTADDLTPPQLEEKATRQCECDAAVEYTRQVTKKDRASKRVKELFGEGAGDDKMPTEVVAGINSFAEMVCDKKIKEITVTIRSGEKARIKMMAKDKVKIERSKTKNESFEE